MRRGVALIVLLSFAAAFVSAASRCEGWHPSAAARMTCCVALGHDCHSQQEADSCCGRAEHAQQGAIGTAEALPYWLVFEGLNNVGPGGAVRRDPAFFHAS